MAGLYTTLRRVPPCSELRGWRPLKVLALIQQVSHPGDGPEARLVFLWEVHQCHDQVRCLTTCAASPCICGTGAGKDQLHTVPCHATARAFVLWA